MSDIKKNSESEKIDEIKGSSVFDLPNDKFPKTNQYLDFIRVKRTKKIYYISFKIFNNQSNQSETFFQVIVSYLTTQTNYSRNYSEKDFKSRKELYEEMDESLRRELKSHVKYTWPQIYHKKPENHFFRVNNDEEIVYTSDEDNADDSCPVKKAKIEEKLKKEKEEKEKDSAEKQASVLLCGKSPEEMNDTEMKQQLQLLKDFALFQQMQKEKKSDDTKEN